MGTKFLEHIFNFRGRLPGGLVRGSARVSTNFAEADVKSFGVGALVMGLLSLASTANAQTANSQSDGRDYEALAYLPKDTLAALVYFRAVSTSNVPADSYSQTQGVFRASYVLKYGNLAIVPFDMLLPVVDVAVYDAPTATKGVTDTLHTSGVGDLTYLPTIGYVIPENETTHTVIAATAYVTAPTGTYSSSDPVNIGDNRWRFQPQIGLSQRFLKVLTFDLIGNLAFYTSNKEFFTPTGYVTMKQNQTFGLEAHATADLSPDMYLGVSYYLQADGERDVSAAMLPLAEADPEQTIQTLRFTLGVRVEKATSLLLQYNQDVAATEGAPLTRFIGARLSHVAFF